MINHEKERERERDTDYWCISFKYLLLVPPPLDLLLNLTNCVPLCKLHKTMVTRVTYILSLAGRHAYMHTL